MVRGRGAFRDRIPFGLRRRREDESAAVAVAVARRDRLVERLTAHQLDLGGALYEMLVRDHVVMPALVERAAAMQEVESALRQAEAEIELWASGASMCGPQEAFGVEGQRASQASGSSDN